MPGLPAALIPSVMFPGEILIPTLLHCYPGSLEIPKGIEYQIYDISLVVSQICKFLQKAKDKQCFGGLDLLKSGVTEQSQQ